MGVIKLTFLCEEYITDVDNNNYSHTYLKVFKNIFKK